MKWFHLTACVIWALLLIPTLIWLKSSILWIASMSLYANFASHWAAFQAAATDKRVKEEDGGNESDATKSKKDGVMVQFRPGVVKNDPRKARLYFRMFRQSGAVAPPSIDFSNIPYIGMLGNDRYGDCVFAGNAHIVEQQTYIGQGTEYQVSTTDTLAAYSRVTGFNPNDPNTDNGAMIQDGLNDLRKIGFGGHVITAFAQLDVANMNDVKLAVAEFGAVSIGFNFPAFAMDQFNHGQAWDVQSTNNQIEGGHCVIVVGYDATYLYVYTWGKVQRMTYAFWQKYVDEAWVIIDREWVNNVTGKDVQGVDLYAFGAQYAALTGQANPFPAPAPTPVPEPTPTPTPAPVPVLDEAEKNLVDAFHRFFNSYYKPRYLVSAGKAWLADKGQSVGRL